MNPALVRKSKVWLSQTAYPYWIQNGIDTQVGDFHEALTFEGLPAQTPMRAMVQARQIYSFRLAERMGILPTEQAKEIVGRATECFIEHFSLPNGSFAHAISQERKIVNAGAEFYTQAFALFALANAYSLTRGEQLKSRAKSLLNYLQRERRAPGGGFTEIKEGVTLYQSNPHMHLIEASIAWMQADSDPAWAQLSDEVAELLRTQFIDPETGALGEHFEAGWKPKRVNGKFIWEPGHHYEWCWLLGNYQKLKGTTQLDPIRHRLFELAEGHGIRVDRQAAVDEVWSDLTVNKSSSRFWPQGERLKAAVQLRNSAAADESVQTLFRYLDQPQPGLWMDTWTSDGAFIGDPVKASSLYHIAGALSEYIEGARE